MQLTRLLNFHRPSRHVDVLQSVSHMLCQLSVIVFSMCSTRNTGETAQGSSHICVLTNKTSITHENIIKASFTALVARCHQHAHPGKDVNSMSNYYGHVKSISVLKEHSQHGYFCWPTEKIRTSNTHMYNVPPSPQLVCLHGNMFGNQ